jgi:hypothetical protein
MQSVGRAEDYNEGLKLGKNGGQWTIDMKKVVF